MKYTDFEKVVTDSRQKMDSGTLFIAIKGEKFDGHDFLADAMANGAGALLVSEERKIPEKCDIPVFKVDDTVAAYQEIANAFRRKFKNLTVAGITGSVGKTSVKEMLRSIFSAAAGSERVLCTAGNTNNQIGVPQNLMRLNDNIRYAVIEMGINHHGEIKPLSRCAEPDAALVNSIAPCHLEFLGSLDGVAEEKAHIFDYLPRPDGVAVIPENVYGRKILEKAAAGSRIFYAGKQIKAEYLGGDVSGSRIKMIFPGYQTEFSWALSGRHQCSNAVNAAALAMALGISPEKIICGLSATELPGGRMKKTSLNGNIYLNDAYNANPCSMKGAIDAIAEMGKAEDTVMILGDMFELGEDAERYHFEVLEYAVKSLPEARLIAVGEMMSKAAEELGREHVLSADEAGKILKDITPGKIIFVKGSRGMKLENALPEAAR